MRILLFGGTFDPPHAGHAALLAGAARRIKPDLILLIPAYQAALKGAPGASAADRLAMARLSLRGARFDLGEIASRRRVYTVETLTRLRRRYPDAQLHFVVGSDAASSFQRWKDWRLLRTLATWWTGRRPGHLDRIPSFFKLVPGRMPNVSSTELRRRLAFGEKTPGLTPAVATHIRRHGLYGARLVEELRAALPPGRFAHTVSVARLAESLADRWDLPASSARLAGLLHDCGRSIPVPRMADEARRRRLRVPHGAGIARFQPLLFHAYLGEDIAKRRFGVKDAAVLSAVRKHTLGDLNMSPLDRLLYVADACSEDRRHPEASRLRRLAFADLEAAFREAVAGKLRYALSLRSWIHPTTIALWNSLATRP